MKAYSNQPFRGSSTDRIRGKALDSGWEDGGCTSRTTSSCSGLWGHSLGRGKLYHQLRQSDPGPSRSLGSGAGLSGLSGPAWLFGRTQFPWSLKPSSSTFSRLLRALAHMWLSASLCPRGLRAARLARPGSVLCPEGPRSALPSS